MKLHGPIAFVEIYGSNGAMSIRRRVRLTFGDPLGSIIYFGALK